MTETDLDRAHRAMEQGGEAERLRFYEQLAATDLVVLLEAEPQDDTISPVVATVDAAQFMLVFDSEDRLAAFAGGVAPYAGLPGRALVEMVAGQTIGLGLNFDRETTGVLIPASAVDWLHGVLGNGPEEAMAQPVAFAPPDGVPADLLATLETRLRSAAGLAQAAYLTEARYADETAGILLVFVGVASAAEAGLAQAVAETLAFSGFENGAVDVAFLTPDARALPVLARQSVEIPIPTPPPRPAPKAPGSDGPPKLR